MHAIGDIIVQPGCKFTAEDPKYETISTSYTYSVLSYQMTPIAFCNFVGFYISTSEVQVTETVEEQVLLPRRFGCECYETVTISYIQVKQTFYDVLTKYEVLELPQPTYIIIWVMALHGTMTISCQTDGSVSTEITFGLSWKQIKIEVQDIAMGLQLFGGSLATGFQGLGFLGGFLFFTSSAIHGKLIDGPASCGPCSGVSQGYFNSIPNATKLIEVHFQIEYMSNLDFVQNENMLGAYLQDDADPGLLGEEVQDDQFFGNSSSLALFCAGLFF
jgi:hypothetical protein